LLFWQTRQTSCQFLVSDLREGIWGAAVCFIVTFPIWLVGGFGGGDVKFLTLIGLIIGADQGLAVLILAQVFAAGYVMAHRMVGALLRIEPLRAKIESLPMAGFFSISVLVVLWKGSY